MISPLTINAGELRHAVDIQSNGTAQDDYGQPVDVWATVLATRAKVEALNLQEKYSSSAGFIGTATHRITMRYQNAVPLLEGMRLVVPSGQVYLIQSVDNVLQRNRKIVVLALEQSPTQ